MGWPSDADIERNRIAEAERQIAISEARDDVEFSQWVAKLEAVMTDWHRSWGNLPYALPLSGSTGLDCWREMYDEGMTPIEAFWADQENWEE